MSRFKAISFALVGAIIIAVVTGCAGGGGTGGSDAGFLSGTAVDATGTGLPGVNITLSTPNQSYTTTSGANGSYSFPVKASDVPAGSTFFVYATGRGTNSFAYNSSAYTFGQSVPIVIGGSSMGTVVVGGTAGDGTLITGRVVDPDGDPFTSTTVTLGTKASTPNTGGYVSFSFTTGQAIPSQFSVSGGGITEIVYNGNTYLAGAAVPLVLGGDGTDMGIIQVDLDAPPLPPGGGDGGAGGGDDGDTPPPPPGGDDDGGGDDGGDDGGAGPPPPPAT